MDPDVFGVPLRCPLVDGVPNGAPPPVLIAAHHPLVTLVRPEAFVPVAELVALGIALRPAVLAIAVATRAEVSYSQTKRPVSGSYDAFVLIWFRTICFD